MRREKLLLKLLKFVGIYLFVLNKNHNLNGEGEEEGAQHHSKN